MVQLQRFSDNPILTPNPNNEWETDGAFNGCVAFHDGTYHMVYRALSSEKRQNGVNLRISSVGYATSSDGIHFNNHRMLFGPTEEWEIYGVEDPRITYFNGKFYIFYTALSVYPFSAYGIKTAVAITKDFHTFEKHSVSTFNAKAMALFPETINGKMAALITMNTDIPPAKIGVAVFEKEEDIWSPYFWEEWYDNANLHTIHLLRDLRDQIELGAPPVKTKDGWLTIYSYIGNYMTPNKDFGIEAVLLDLDDPRKIIGRTTHSLLNPETDYELHGDIPNIVFPSGALVKDDELYVYYGAADTRVAAASCKLDDLLQEIHYRKSENRQSLFEEEDKKYKLRRYKGNPIIKPAFELSWQALAVYNPAAIYENGMVHILYRSQSVDGTSGVGYATSKDGIHIDENLDVPIYMPREPFELKFHQQGNSGCEDPRISRIGDRYYMLYTAYDGVGHPRVAMTSILVEDFLNRKWKWELPILISPAEADDKDACFVKREGNPNILAFHRLGREIWLDVTREINFREENALDGKILAQPRPDKWDNLKLGIAGPPEQTEKGWLLLYHGVGDGGIYRVGAMLLDYDDPFNVLGRTDEPIFEPEKEYEKEGLIPNVVFPCGSVIIDGTLYVYYGGADKVVGVAIVKVDDLLNHLLKK
jgi:beta-1,2-mannobiose phosphorylase / 1,2-beta-oligomannan phosphorylase